MVGFSINHKSKDLKSLRRHKKRAFIARSGYTKGLVVPITKRSVKKIERAVRNEVRRSEEKQKEEGEWVEEVEMKENQEPNTTEMKEVIMKTGTLLGGKDNLGM